MTKNQTTLTLSPYQQQKRDARIALILDTARMIMRAEGVAALSMQELARRLDMRAPSLYNYFSSKNDIYDALFRLGFTLFGEHISKSFQDEQNWLEKLHTHLEAYMTFALQNPELFQLCFERPVPGFVPSEESLEVSFGLLNQSYEFASNLLPAIDSGLTSQQFVDLLIAIMHGLTASHIANEPHLPVGEGRFGSLIPVVISVLERAWSKP